MNAINRDPFLTHDVKLDRLGEVAVRVGLGLEKGQELVMTCADRRAAAGPPHH